jgi:hypothetical protein
VVYYNNGKPIQVEIFKREFVGYYGQAGKTTIRVRDIKRIESIKDKSKHGTSLSRVMFKSGGSIVITSRDADELSRHM